MYNNLDRDRYLKSKLEKRKKERGILKSKLEKRERE